MPNYFTEFQDGPSGPSYKVKDEEAHSSINAVTNVYSAKNFCPVYKNCKTATVEGVTFTVYSNGSIKINGTSTADIDFDIIPENRCSLKPGSYIVNGGLPKPEGNTYYLTVSVVTDVTWGEPLIEGALVYDGDTDPIAINNVAGAGAYTLHMHIDSGVTISNKTIKPMIRDARIADPTFASYAMTNKELTDKIGVIDRSNTITADTEQSPATKAHTAGEYLTYNHTTYRVKTNIAIGDSLVVDTNIEAPDLPDGTLILSDDDEAPALYYNELLGKPSVNGVTLTGNKTASDLSLADAGTVEAIVNVNGSKNILPIAQANQSENNVSVIANTDGSFTVSTNGSASADTVIWLEKNKTYPLCKAGIRYIWSCGVTTGSASSYGIVLDCRDSNNTYQGGGALYTETERQFKPTADAVVYSVYIVVKSGTTISTPITFYPMLRDARITDPTFAPYAMTNRELTESLATKDVSSLFSKNTSYVDICNAYRSGNTISVYIKTLAVNIPNGTKIVDFDRSVTSPFNFGIPVFGNASGKVVSDAGGLLGATNNGIYIYGAASNTEVLLLTFTYLTN